MACHILKVWPRHDLEKISVDGRRNAVCRRGSRQSRCTGWMDVVQVVAGPQDFLELSERAAPFGLTGFVRRQVAGNNVRTNIAPIFCWGVDTGYWGDGRPEVRASSQISGRIGFLLLAKVRVETISEIEVRRATRGVTKVAIVCAVDQIAAQAHKVPVFPIQIQRNRRYLETYTDASGLVVLPSSFSVILRFQHSHQNNG